MRKFGLILLKDILDDSSSLVTQQFNNILTEESRNIIKNKFALSSSEPQQDDDIYVSVDQTRNLSSYIAEGYTYPSPDDFDALVDFLDNLREIFNWEFYEKKYSRRFKKN